MPNDNATATTTTVKPYAERLEQGVTTMAALLNQWIGASGFTHQQLVNVAAWGLGEQGVIDTTIISNLKNAKKPKGPSWRVADALAAANEAIWLWHTQGPSAALAKLGPHSSYGITAKCLDDAVWMPAPEDPDQPLRLGHFASIMTGRLELPYLVTIGMTPREARLFSDALARTLNQAIVDSGLGAMDGIAWLMRLYPVTEKQRQGRMKRLILGEIRLTHEQLTTEMPAIAAMLREVRGLSPKSYGPAELRDELRSVLPPAS